MTALRIVVSGAHGRMGRLVVEACGAEPDLALAGTVGRGDDATTILETARADVLVDFTVAAASYPIVEDAVAHGVSPVIGTSGWADAEVTRLASRCAAAGLGALLVPNFSIGAVLQMRWAEEAARHLRCTDLHEVHHPAKRDAPSGTARATADRIAGATPDGHPPPIRSERTEGIVARQSVAFEGPGESLACTHEVRDRRAYLPGLLLAVRAVRQLDGLHVGLDALLDRHLDRLL